VIQLTRPLFPGFQATVGKAVTGFSAFI